jgi:hypothetical protein
MRITESAANVILGVMSNNGLDPKKFLLSFEKLSNGALGFTFIKNEVSEWREFYGLRVNVAINMDITVDLGEFDGKKGIIFLANHGE